MSHNDHIKSMPSALQQAALDSSEYKGKSLELAERSGWSALRLRSKQNLPGLPGQTGLCTGKDPAILCLRPGEWLMLSDTASPQQLKSEIPNEAQPRLSRVFDNTHGLAIFRLRGAGAPWLLSKLSGLDYLAGVKSGTHCAQTLMGHISVIVYWHESNEGNYVFDLIMDRSYARYYWELLVASATHADDLALAYGGAA
ncbi:hypothetical protein ACFL0N_01290 [Pseudomonadota bacterium]